MARILEAELCCSRSSYARLYAIGRRIDRYLRLDLMAAVLTTRRLARYSAILSLSEKIAIPLAALSTVRRMAIPHVVIAHKLSSGHKVRLFRTWPLHRRFDHLITVSRSQADYAVSTLKFPSSRVNFVYDKVDQLFFQPQPDSAEGYVLTVGTEQRDFDTLLHALRGTDMRAIILANSLWANHPVRLRGAENVSVLTSPVSYLELRRLYAGARMVVIPLRPVDYAAGVNSTLEAMAMGKPLIVSQNEGLRDYVTPGETGWFARSGDAHHLQEQMLRLWSDAAARRRLGANARQAVLQQMNLDLYVDRVAGIVGQAATRHAPGVSPANNSPA